MKKLIIISAVILASITVKAASFSWSFSGLYGPDGVNKYNGLVTLTCSEVSGWSTTATASNGTVKNSATEFSSDLFSAGSYYTFTFEAISGDYKFSATYSDPVLAHESDVISIPFGSFSAATKDVTTAWKTEAVPEPTSGLLLLCGLAGLALRRKRA